MVLGQAELLERRALSNPGAPVDAAGVSRMTKEARRLRDLISEMLDAQRLEHGLTMDRHVHDLRSVVDAVCRRRRDEGIDVLCEHADAAVLSSVDETRMQQVLENLVENALKYGPANPPPEIRIASDATTARIAVVDHGAGVPEAERDRVFERFYRASNAQGITDTGMGLGLFICRQIVEQHDGRIDLEPTPGGGSTFVISLPLATEATVDEPVETRSSSTAPGIVGVEAPADA